MTNLIRNPMFSGDGNSIEGWKFLTPRPELALQHSIRSTDEGRKRLVLTSPGDIHAFGCWRGEVKLEPGCWYQAGVRARIHDIESPHLSLFSQVANHFLLPQYTEGEEIIFQRRFRHDVSEHPSRMELYFRASERGSVEWYDPSVIQVPPPAPRMARVATVRFGERKDSLSPADQQKRIAGKLDEAGNAKADIVVFPETASLVGVLGDQLSLHQQTAEEIPTGPVCRILSEAAVKYGMYVIAGLITRQDRYLFNTAVIFDRKGKFLGRYDKTHLTFDELRHGLSCGAEYPVFDLDFGRIGIHICYDEWFPEVSRYYAHQGAEILFLPVAGGKPITWRTRAMDNRVYFVAASITPPSMIIDSSGIILAEVHDDGIAVMDLNLNERKTNWYRDPTLTYGMPCIWPQMRNALDDELLNSLHAAMQRPMTNNEKEF